MKFPLRLFFPAGLIVNVNKPGGITSFAVVQYIRRFIDVRKVGHAGTLDPFATGVLLICIGKATKQVSKLTELKKEYRGTMKLGNRTDTYDIDGRIIEEKEIPPITLSKLREIADDFTGNIEQVPPIFSAIKQGGIPLYKLARSGKTVELTPRQVKIYSFTILDYKNPFIDFQVICSSGTYIRSLANDFGNRLGCGAYLHSLIRTSIGTYTLDDAVPLNAIPEFLKNKIAERNEAVS